MAETRRKLYAQVTGDEDFATGFKINRGLGAIAGRPLPLRSQRGRQPEPPSLDRQDRRQRQSLRLALNRTRTFFIP